MPMSVVVTFILAGIMFGAISSSISHTEQMAKAGRIANWINSIVNGYKIKIVDEESEDGYNFEGLALSNGATLDISGDNVVLNLLADGTSSDPNHPACTSGGTTVGLSKRGYLPCDFQTKMPTTGSTEISVSFERTSPASAPAHYTTGYSQIKGTFIIGSTAIDKPFRLSPERVADPKMATLILGALSQQGLFQASNLLNATTTDYYITKEGALVVTLDLTQNNEIAIRSDGAIPFNNDQSMGNNDLLDVDQLVWSVSSSSDSNNSTLKADGGINLADGGDLSLKRASSATSGGDLSIDGGDLSMTSGNLSMTSGDLSMTSGDLSMTGGTFSMASGAGAGAKTTSFTQSASGLEVTSELLKVTGKFQVTSDAQFDSDATFTGNVKLDGGATVSNGQAITMEDSGVSLFQVPQLQGFVNPGGEVVKPTCKEASSQRILATPNAIVPDDSSVAAILGYYPVVTPHSTNDTWVVDLKLITENGVDVSPSSNSIIQVITYCDES